MITIDEMVEMEKCPCPMCNGRDEEETILEKGKLKQLDDICDLFSNEIIDLIIENPRKYLLKQQNKQDNVE